MNKTKINLTIPLKIVQEEKERKKGQKVCFIVGVKEYNK